nr:RHS repeat-associated core domain-containing protein [Puniceicoccus vermicola]
MDGFEVTVTDDLLRATTTLYEDGTNEVLVYGSNCCSGSISSRTDRKGIQTTYTYDLLGRRLSETRQGITRVTEYDAVGRVLQTSRESGASSQILSTAQYDKAGRVVSRSQAGPYQDGTLVTTSYSYSYPAEGGTVETVTRPDATTEIRTTYIGGQTESVAGTAAAPMKMTYDTFTDGGVSGIAERQIRLREDSENPGEFLETEWQEVRSVMGRQIAVVYPDSAEVTTAYNALGQVSEEVDPDGVTTRYQYDGLGRRSVMAVKTSASAGIDLTADQVTEWEYEYAERNENLFGTAADYTVQRTRTYVYPEDASSARTLVQTTERSTLGIATWTTDTAGAESLSYRTTPAAGDWNEISVQPSGARSIREYDDGLIVREEFRDSTDSLVSATDYTHDLWNRTATSVDSRTGTTTYAYFDNDQPSQVTAPDPDGGSGSLSALVTSYEYDDLGRTTEVTLPDSSVVYTEYTDRGEVAKTWGSQQFPVEYTYDAQGRMATMTTWQDFNPGTGIGVSGDAITIWEYDVQRGWLVRKEYDDGKGTDYTYTDAGRLATRTWERGVVTTYGYDDAGRQTSVDYSDSTDDIAYTYDRLGQPKTITDATGTRTFDYNAELRLETEELDASYFDDRILTRLYQDGTSGTVAGRNGGFSLGIAADPDHDLSVGYSYDSAGRLSTVSDGTDTFTYGYLANTPGMLAETEGPAHTASYTYEPGRNALTIVENEETVGTLSTVSQYSYRYDALGRRTDRVDEGSAFAQASLYDWTYDDRGQVTTADRYLGTDPDSPGASVAAATDSFDYDFIGNRLTSTFGTASQRSYTVDSLNQYTGITNPSAGPAHDVDGNMTYDGVGWYFEWNGENRMIEARNYADVMNPTSGAVRLTFTYDYQGRRVEKTVEEYDVPLASMQTVSEERFVYDGWNLIATYDSQVSGLNLQVSYLWGQDLSGSMQGAGGVGGLLSVTDDSSGDVFYATYDANGNVSEYIDETGGIAAHYEYSSFGRVIASTVLPDDFVFRFSTKYQDNETDLLYYGFRYYVPETGRWLSRDPIGERGGLNLYGFVWNNGLKWWDYLGLAIVDEYYFPESAENISYRFDPLDFDQGGITEIRKSASCDCYFDEEKKCYRVYCQITLELSITINELLRGNDGLIENAYGHEQQHVSRVIAQVRNMASHYRDNHSAVFESDSKCQSDSRGPEYVQRAMRDVLDTIEELHVYHIEPFSPEKGKPYDPINPVPPALN